MKKRVISICIILLLLSAVSCVSVGCNDATRELTMSCPIDKVSFRLPFPPVHGVRAGLYTSFDTDMSLQDMYNEVKKHSKKTVTAELYENFLVVKMPCFGQHNHFYVVEKLSDDGNLNYAYTTPSQSFRTEEADYYIMVPYFLLDMDMEDSASEYYYEIELDKEYRLACSPEQIADFYREVGIYDIEQTDTAINIAVRPDAYIADGYVMHTHTSFTIETARHADGVYVKYTNFKNI